MKKLILILVALAGLISSVSAETVEISEDIYIISNDNIGTITYVAYGEGDFEYVMKTLLENDYECICFIGDNANNLDNEVRILTLLNGITVGHIIEDDSYVVNVTRNGKYQFYRFVK